MLYILAFILGVMGTLTIEFMVLISVAIRRDKDGKNEESIRKQSDYNNNQSN